MFSPKSLFSTFSLAKIAGWGGVLLLAFLLCWWGPILVDGGDPDVGEQLREAGLLASLQQQEVPTSPALPLANLPYTDSLPRTLGRLEGVSAVDQSSAVYLLFQQNDSTLVGVWARTGYREDGSAYHKIKMIAPNRFPGLMERDQRP